MESTNKWPPHPEVPAPTNVSPVVVPITSDKWHYTKGLLMTIEGSRLKAHMIQTLYRKAKESEQGGWHIPFSIALVREALHVSLEKALPTFDAAHRAKFPELSDVEGVESFFQKIKANFEKGRLKTYMRETASADANGLGPPGPPEGAEPDLELTDSKILYHKSWLQNYAWCVCQWMDRSSRTGSAKKRSSTGTGNSAGTSIATPSRKRQRTSMFPSIDNFAATGSGRGANLGTVAGMSTSNIESMGSSMATGTSSTSADDVTNDTLQFGFKCLFAMVAAANKSIESMERMRVVAQYMYKEAEERQGVRQERAKQIVKSMREATMDSLQGMY